MSILVTGGAGYIGSHLVLALLDQGESVIVLDNLSTGFAWAVPNSVKLILGDVSDQDLVSQVIKAYDVQAIVHFAAKLLVPESVERPLDYYDNNTSATCKLVQCAVANGVKQIIFSSSAAVYGSFSSGPVDEKQELRPQSPYGRSKLMCEWILEDAAKAHELRSVSLRYFNVAGADPLGRAGQSSLNATHLIKVAAQAALGKRSGVAIFGVDYPTHDGTCIRDYVHVTDLAQAHLDALTYLRKGGQTGAFNCGYGTGFSVLEVINAVKSISGVDFPVHIAERRNGDPAVIFANADLIKQQLGWRPRHQVMEEMIAQSILWESGVDARISATRSSQVQAKSNALRLEIATRAKQAIERQAQVNLINDNSNSSPLLNNSSL